MSFNNRIFIISQRILRMEDKMLKLNRPFIYLQASAKLYENRSNREYNGGKNEHFSNHLLVTRASHFALFSSSSVRGIQEQTFP